MAKEETRKIDTGIIQRGASYRFTVYMGYGVDGKQIRKTKTFNPPKGMTQKQADKLAKREYLEFYNLCHGVINLKENMRFSELTEEFFRLYVSNELKESTAYYYKCMVDKHFIGYFGNMKLKDISPATISDFFDRYKNGKAKALAQSTLEHIILTSILICQMICFYFSISGNLLANHFARGYKSILQVIFRFAVKMNFIKESPADNAIIPKMAKKPEEKKMFLTVEESIEFIGLFQDYSPLNAAVLIMMYTGIRVSECLGLQWDDIDFENRTIHINHTLSNVGGKKYLSSPKTKTSKRAVFMTDSVYGLLKKHYIKQKELQLALGESFLHPEMVFTANNGNYKDRSAMHLSLKRKLKGTKFEFMHLHILRHTNATLLLNRGVDLKIVSEHLGHSGIGVTANVYVDILDSTRMATANLIGEILENKTPNKHQIEKTS